MNIKIVWLYPDLMSTYGDRGNILTLKRRCFWRQIEVSIIAVSLEDSLPQEVDLIFMGGAQDRQQKLAAEDLYNNKGPILREMIENGTPALFVCAAYQFMGHYFRPAEGEDIPGLGIFDLYTQHFGKDKPRCIGNVAITTNIQDPIFDIRTLVGFENHGGRTYLGSGVTPLGKVIHGHGNNGEDDTEGIVYKNAIGSYFHGPLLPKNPHLADFLIKTSLKRKYREFKLTPLDDTLEWQAHKVALRIAHL